LLSIDDLDWTRVLRVGKITATSVHSLRLRPEVIDWVKREYLPLRDTWVEGMGRAWLASNLSARKSLRMPSVS